MEMQGAAELIHGEIFDTDADGHSASTQLKIRCYGTTYVRMRLVSGSGAGDEDRPTAPARRHQYREAERQAGNPRRCHPG
ncbi:hypothetical protein G6F68_021452 [Rhizopus microsporus]|nr:hypothetical protein G6F68_021452 [Rhizopus microsporus]